jgi:hypothetical protein
VAHWWCKGQRKFLVRYKGFGPSFDEWKREEDVSEQLVKSASTPAEPDPSRRIQAQRRDRDERAARRRR